MNIGEAASAMRVLDFLAGDIDHEDEVTRAAVAKDCLWLQTRARAALGAGRSESEAEWDTHLCNVTFEGVSA